MGGDQLPNKFNVLGADLAAPINKLVLHDRQLRRSKLERKWIAAFFPLPPLGRVAKPSGQSHATAEPPGRGWGCRSTAATEVDAHPDPVWLGRPRSEEHTSELQSRQY